MKNKRIWCILLLFLLSGCGSEERNSNKVLVSLLPTEGCIIPANGQEVISGEDAVFEIALEPGYALTSVDYAGEYEYFVENGREFLRICDVRYPSRIRIILSNRFRTIHYEPNGGQGETYSINYDTEYRSRPNTSTGENLFEREGHTLVCWNSEPDGSGQRIGLGSRATIPESELTLYAQWAKWTDPSKFQYVKDGGAVITGYEGSDSVLVIPEMLGGLPVVALATGAFENCQAQRVILPRQLQMIEDGAFTGASLKELVVFDSVIGISSGAFDRCDEMRTIYINAHSSPCGHQYRKETCFADKVDLLIEAQGQKKIVFYGGCSMWYNLNAEYMQQQIGSQYRVINAGLNGVINSALQMQIITAYLEPEDIFFHTPELSSKTQLMLVTTLETQDDKLWCGLELNYDLLTLVDARRFPDLLDSWNQWLNFRKTAGSYTGRYEDEKGRVYLDDYGSIPFERFQPEGSLEDGVCLDPNYLQKSAMEVLEQYYRAITQKDVRIYVSYACVNMDAVPLDQRENIRLMDEMFRSYLEEMDCAVLISSLEDYRYSNADFFDTNYHLLSPAVQKNTELWLRDLKARMQLDGLWEKAT